MRYGFMQEYPVGEKGYPTDLPIIEDFIVPPYYTPSLKSYGIEVWEGESELDLPHRWAVQFFLLLNSHFALFHKYGQYDEDDVISLTEKVCSILFWSFNKTLQKLELRFSTICSETKLWVVSTQRVVWAAFMKNRLSSDTLNNKRGTARLLRALLFKLDELYESVAEKDSRSPYMVLDNYVFFNMWGVEYESFRENNSEKIPLTSNEKALVDVQANKYAFYTEIESRIKEATECREESEFYNKENSLCIALEQMFVDYMSHYQELNIHDSDVISFICNHWRHVALSVIQRAYSILSAEYAVEVSKGRFECLMQCKNGEELYAHEKRAIIVQKATETVKNICESYLKRLDFFEKKRFSFVELVDDDIRKIHTHIFSNVKRIKPEHRFSEDVFLTAIYTGDYSMIYVEGIQDKLKYTTRVLKDYASEGWLESVAKSIGKKPHEIDGSKGYNSSDFTRSFPIPCRNS